ncbi:uncharacterized protein LOC133912882 isoform X3 [Phragmites australis]|nr:uncharacterized protein LOC133912882 isoform X3 [Phragmites australis]
MAFFDLNKCLDEDHSGQGRSEVLQDFDLNRYPEEQIPHQDYTYQLVLRDFDLNLVPQQEIEVERPYQGSAASNGHIIKYSCKKELTNDQRKEVYKALALRSTKGKVSREIVKDIAASFLVSPRTVWHIWRRASQCFKQGENIDVTKKRYNCGRKDLLVDLSKMQDIPVSKRTTLDDLSRHLHVSKTKLWKLKQQGQIKRHSNTIKPLLKDENKKERLR